MSPESIKVLLVEDNLGDARLLYEGLEEALPGQFQMTHVRRLSETLEALWEESCNVVLLDLGLPDSHGLDTLIMTRAQAPDVPIVVLTGFEDEAMAGQALKEGAQDYLVKGAVDSNLLARSMRYAIARKAAEKAMVQRGVALARAEDLQLSRQRLIAVHERVRRDVALQLQDGVQPKLLNLMTRLREIMKTSGAAPQTAQALSDVIDDLSLLVERPISALSLQLYPATLNHGLVPALQSIGDQFGSALAIEIELDDTLVEQVQADPNLISEPVALAAYRIAEEALVNVVAHTKAGKVCVRLDSPREAWLRLTVRDDGQGFDVDSASHGLGMATMQDYAGAVDGECVVHSIIGASTEVTAVLPLSRPDAEHMKAFEKGDN